MSTPAIHAEHLGKSFGSFRALDGLSFSVPAGSIYGLLGPNGAGKTTTIKILMNLIAPTDGHAEVLGRRTEKLAWGDFQRIGYVSENQVLPEEMRVGELLDYLRPYYPTWDPALCDDLKRQLDLPMNRRLKNLSRGMKMKAALLSSLAFRPELIVLDEPFSGLDPVVREDFSRGLLSSVSESEWTVFLSSQDVEEVERLCDWIGILDSGRLMISEPLDQLLRRFQRIDITLPDASAATNIFSADVDILSLEQSGTRLGFVHQRFSGEETFASVRSRLPVAAVMEAFPLTLREIYLALVRKPEPATP
jgi:ABC-2 type transport system ATP-binding protein